MSLRSLPVLRTAGATPAASGHLPRRVFRALAVLPACPLNNPVHNRNRLCTLGARSDGANPDEAPARDGGRRLGCGGGGGCVPMRRMSSAPRVSGDGVRAVGRLAESTAAPTRVDAVVIGAGQAGLSVAYHLQKEGGLRFVTLDANQEPGGAWRHRWPSLQLFSTRRWSSLPGLPMSANGGCDDGYPTTREMAMYMEEYEEAMKLNVVRPVTVTGVTQTSMGTFLVETDCLMGGAPARWECRAVISAAGTHGTPVWPRLPGSELFRGVQIHSSQYRSAEDFRGARVMVVGAGNSGAQILAEVSEPGMAASTMWSTEGTPSFLPRNLTGKEIFDTVARLRQRQGFVRREDIPSLDRIIMQPGVREAMDRGVYDDHIPALTHFTPTGVAWDAETRIIRSGGQDGEEREVFLPGGHAEVDAVIWCTGYNANTSHLARLGLVRQNSTITMAEGDMGKTDVPGVFAVGYGNWSGVGSASIPGATMYARRAALTAIQHLRGESAYDISSTLNARMQAWPTTAQGSSLWPKAGRAGSSASKAEETWSWKGGSRATLEVTGVTVTRGVPKSKSGLASASKGKPAGRDASDSQADQEAIPVAA